MKWGLALAGGGTRGSYHIGVWKALRELGKSIEAVTGTSIGAVNGAFIVSDAYDEAVDIWNSIEMTDIVKLTEEIKEKENLFGIKNLFAVINELRSNKGIDVTPFEKILNSRINESRVRKSAVDYGLVTYNISDNKSMQLFKKDIPDGKLCEYIMASAAFPGFKPKKIGRSVYVDGGVRNNMPVDMLIERDCDNIIAVDVGGIGIVRSANVSGRNIVTVRPSELVVGIMDFNTEAIKKNISQGYYDTMKAFGKYSGKYFYFTDYLSARLLYSAEIIEGIEKAGRIMGMERFRPYSTGEFVSELLGRYAAENKEYSSELMKFTDEKYIMCCISHAIVTGNNDWLNNKFISGLSGGVFEGARAISYFMKTLI